MYMSLSSITILSILLFSSTSTAISLPQKRSMEATRDSSYKLNRRTVYIPQEEDMKIVIVNEDLPTKTFDPSSSRNKNVKDRIVSHKIDDDEDHFLDSRVLQLNSRDKKLPKDLEL